MLLQKGCVGKSGLICRNPPIERWYHKIVIGVRVSPLVTLLDRALQVVLCEHRHILGQGVYVLHAQNQAYLLPVRARGGYTKNHVTNVASQASCVLHSLPVSYYEAAEQKHVLGVELV